MTADTSLPLSALDAQVGQLLSSTAQAPNYEAALKLVAGAFHAPTATLHRADLASEQLHMVAYLGLPEKLVAITRQIPFGKGIAGLCATERKPIELCNLQTDASGAARPGAKQTGVSGAISVPVFAPDGALTGTLGVGKIEEHTYTEQELQVLAACAEHLGRALAS